MNPNEALPQVKARFSDGWLSSIDTGPGWYGIIERLDAELAKIDPDYKVVQVKEKFGGLRYYLAMGEFEERAQALIAAAEEESMKTCEDCGKPGTNQLVNSWWHTVCEEDRDRRIKERAEAFKEEAK